MKKFFLISSVLLSLLILPQSSFAFCTDSIPEKYRTSMETLFNQGILKGVPGPNNTLLCQAELNLNRIQVIVFGLRAINLENSLSEVANGTEIFTDVKADDGNKWFTKALLKAKEMGIAKGDAATKKFRPTDNVNLVEGLSILLRAYSIPVPSPKENEAWYNPVIVLAKDYGLHPDIDTLSPTYVLKRGDLSIILANIQYNIDDLKEYTVDSSPSSPAPSASSTPSSSPTPSSIPSPSVAPKSNLSFRQFLDNYYSLTNEQIANTYVAISDSDVDWLRLYGSFGLDVMFKGCQSNSNLYLKLVTGQAYNCAQSNQIRAESLQLMEGFSQYGWGSADEQLRKKIESDRSAILIALKCGTGEIDAGSCAMYGAATQNYNNMMHETNTRIIDNIGGKCRIGIDPNCEY